MFPLFLSVTAHDKQASGFQKISFWFFGIQTENEKKLLKNILADTDSNFLKWAIDKIVSWTNKTKIKNLKHIHGTADKIFPLRFMQVDKTVFNGGHFMVLNKADEITTIIKQMVIN